MVTTGGNKSSRRRNEQRKHRQRSSSLVNGSPQADSVSLRAHKMLQSIQSEDSTSLLTASPSVVEWPENVHGHHHHLHHNNHSPLDYTFPLQPPPTPSSPLNPAVAARRRRTSADHTARSFTAPMIQAPGVAPLLANSRSTSTRVLRTRKTSRKPPPFDRSSLPPRVTARRFSTK